MSRLDYEPQHVGGSLTYADESRVTDISVNDQYI